MHRPGHVTNPVSAGSPNRLLRIPAAEFDQLRPHLEQVPLTPGDFYLSAGEPLSHVYFPYSGLVSLIISMQDGATVQVATVGHRGMLGISVFLESDPAPYEMVCQVRGEAVRLSVQSFIELSDRLHGFRRLLHRYSLCLLHEISRTAACNNLHSVEQRLARWLLLCSDQVAADTYPLTHESLARMLGARRPYVSRTARALRQDGLIQYSRGTLRITDRAGLEAVACEDYRATQQEYNRLLG